MPIQQFGPSRRRAYLLQILMFAMLGVLAGCGMQLRPDPSSAGATIAGQWQLQSPARAVLADQVRVVMQQARDKQESRERQAFRNRPESDINFSPPETDGDATDHAPPGRGPRRLKWEAHEQMEQQEALLNAVLPNDKLQIIQSASRIEFVPLPGARRRFDKDVRSALVTRYASLRVESGWQANVFVVHSRDSEQNINIIERYQRIGERLHMQVQLSIPDAKDIFFAADYQLAKPTAMQP